MGEWWEERTVGEKAVIVMGFVALGIGALFLFGLIVMWLWNWLMPDIFGLPEINYWKAWGLLLLSCILFKDFGSGSSENKSERKRKRKLREYMEDEDRPAGDTPPRDDDSKGNEATGDGPTEGTPDGSHDDEQTP